MPNRLVAINIAELIAEQSRYMHAIHVAATECCNPYCTKQNPPLYVPVFTLPTAYDCVFFWLVGPVSYCSSCAWKTPYLKMLQLAGKDFPGKIPQCAEDDIGITWLPLSSTCSSLQYSNNN